MAYYELEPFGEEWKQTATIARATRSPYAKSGEKLESFYPFRQREEPQSPRDMEVVFRAFGAHLESVSRGNNR